MFRDSHSVVKGRDELRAADNAMHLPDFGRDSHNA
jgi:hypothetical protein